jgi:hypothetical protein
VATRVIYQKVSDISGQTIEAEEEVITIDVEHPDFPEIIHLDATDSDVAGRLPEPQEYVSLTINGQRYLLSLPEFDDLFGEGNSEEILTERFREQQKERKQQQAVAPGKRQATARKDRVNWASPERAGEPHPGRVSPAEQEYVREHLEEVNARLAANDQREIDPNDAQMARRYGFNNTAL